jgi:hypothetical protein
MAEGYQRHHPVEDIRRSEWGGRGGGEASIKGEIIMYKYHGDNNQRCVLYYKRSSEHSIEREKRERTS